MAYKDLLVVHDTEPQARQRLLLAADLAERFNAHLVGLHLTVGVESARYSGRSDSDADRSMRALFDDVVGRRSISAEWRMASGYPLDVTAVHARFADLTILGQLDPEKEWASVIYPRPEDLALSTGRPVLVVPYTGAFSSVGQRVLVGWDASREAARTVNDAMPLLAAASSVTVITIDPKQSREDHGDVPGADITLHLARHGVQGAGRAHGLRRDRRPQRATLAGERSWRRSVGHGRLRPFAGARADAWRRDADRARQHDPAGVHGALRRRDRA
jgi:hypothetical protein